MTPEERALAAARILWNQGLIGASMIDLAASVIAVHMRDSAQMATAAERERQESLYRTATAVAEESRQVDRKVDAEVRRMTIEERATELATKLDYFVSGVHDPSELVESITAAIRQAVDTERERCEKVLESAAAEWEADARAGSASATLLQGMADGARICIGRLRSGS